MPQLDFDGANSKISADKIQGQSGTTVTIPAGHNLAGDGSGLTSLSAANITSGGTLPALNGSALTNLPAHSGNVAFPATQVASADANTLDDYEEGTWTPRFASTWGSGPEATMGPTTGYYVKIGRLVIINAFVITTSVSGLAAASYIKDLPFACSSDTTANNVISTTQGGGLAITPGTYISGMIDRNTTHLRLQLWDSAVGTSHLVTTTEWTDDGSLYISGHYFV